MGKPQLRVDEWMGESVADASETGCKGIGYVVKMIAAKLAQRSSFRIFSTKILLAKQCHRAINATAIMLRNTSNT
jgi:hypothetical protein